LDGVSRVTVVGSGDGVTKCDQLGVELFGGCVNIGTQFIDSQLVRVEARERLGEGKAFGCRSLGLSRHSRTQSRIIDGENSPNAKTQLLRDFAQAEASDK